MPLYKRLDVTNEATINEPILEQTIDNATGGNVRTSGVRLIQKNIVVRCLPNIYFNTVENGEGPIFNNHAIPEYCRTNLSVQVIWPEGLTFKLNNDEEFTIPQGGYQTLNNNNNFVIKHKNQIIEGDKGTKLDNITYDGDQIYFGDKQYTNGLANFNGGFYFFLGIIHDITYSAQAWYPRIVKHITDATTTVTRDDNTIQSFLYVTKGTVNIKEGVTDRDFKKESCLLLQKNKTYTISQVGDEEIDVYEFKSVKKAASN
jgi:hypothetical protein